MLSIQQLKRESVAKELFPTQQFDHHRSYYEFFCNRGFRSTNTYGSYQCDSSVLLIWP